MVEVMCSIQGRRAQALSKKPEVRMRRIYDKPTGRDGIRVLLDRVWPRGLSRDEARIDEWCKEVAPSTKLRTWYAHELGGSRSSPGATEPSSKIPSERRR
jgi:hypothetical protein